jgi:hypothetical protein
MCRQAFLFDISRDRVPTELAALRKTPLTFIVRAQRDLPQLAVHLFDGSVLDLIDVGTFRTSLGLDINANARRVDATKSGGNSAPGAVCETAKQTFPQELEIDYEADAIQLSNDAAIAARADCE